LPNSPVLALWRDGSAPTPAAPLRFLEAPGPALLRQNVPWLRVATDPLPIRLEQLARATGTILALFGLERMSEALTACQQLAARGKRLFAVRGRLVPAEARGDFEVLSLEPGLAPLLERLGHSLPTRWTSAVVAAGLYHPRLAGLRLGALFSRPPELGVLELRDLFERAQLDGGPAPAPPAAVTPDEGSHLLDAFLAAGLRTAMVVDLGGHTAELAELAFRRGMLGAWLGPAASPLPEVVRRGGCPVLTWFEAEDCTPQALERRARLPASGVAWVPVALDGEGIPEATARLLAIRALGYSAVAPRYRVPWPNTREWQAEEVRFGLRPTSFDRLRGEHLVFRLPGWDAVQGPELLEVWRRDDRWPMPSMPAGSPRRSIAFETMRSAIDEYLVDAQGRVPTCHARDLLATVLSAISSPDVRVQEIEDYPFLALEGRNLLDVVQAAIEARLLSLGDLPPDLNEAVRHAALVGGKRIRPILTLAMACAMGVPLDAAMPAALATEWLHTASLLQDDLPCMDDDDVRRRDVATHRRYGEAMALLASDTLVALAFEDVSGLTGHPQVGPARAARLVAEVAATIGGQGLVGGQVRDLLTRRAERVSLQDVLEVHRRKTAPLFRLTAVLATILSDAEADVARPLTEMLTSLGLAFQVVDDVLDATPGNDAFGRPAGSDRRNNLPSFATLMGTAAGRRYASTLMAPHAGLVRAHPDLFGLERLSRYLLERTQ
jgi:geranylgeranyl diphosphate synthase type II